MTVYDPKAWHENAEPLTYTTRGGCIETVQSGHFAVVEAHSSRLIAQGGLPDLQAFPRSSLKFIQALALVETGAADAFNLSDRHLAIACASHYGEQGHADLVRSWLRSIQCSPADLCCGSAWPWLSDDRDALCAAQGQKQPEIHNCSGKHTGFLTVCRHQNWQISGYDRPDHPAQERFAETLLDVSGVFKGDVAWGIDGCTLPTPSLPIQSMAKAMSFFAKSKEGGSNRGQAAKRLLKALEAHPWYLAGSKDFATELALTTKGRIISKIGAAGYYVAVIRDKGWGLALKTIDGSLAVADGAFFTLLQRLKLLSEDEIETLRPIANRPILNSQNKTVGERLSIL